MTPMPTRAEGYGIAPGGRSSTSWAACAWATTRRRRCSTATARRTTCKNLFVTDGGPFVSQADKNPTWTILALAMRTGDYIAEQRKAGSDMKRRDVLKVLLAAPAATFSWTDAEAAQAAASAQAARAATTAKPFVPKFFTATEFRLVRMLADIVIPKDERSGSATDAGVPEFMDFMMIDQPTRQVAMRGGLAWLDVECQKRFDKTFLACADAERTAVLDDIAWPAKAQAGACARCGVLQQLPRSHGERLLDDAHGHRRSAVHGQPLGRALERLPC